MQHQCSIAGGSSVERRPTVRGAKDNPPFSLRSLPRRGVISVPLAIVASVIAPMDAHSRLGVDSSASLISVTRAVSVVASNTPNERAGAQVSSATQQRD